jgi:hypothetical protein
MKKSLVTAYICFIGIIILATAMNLDSGASPEGRGDDLREYNCVNSCHFSRSDTSGITIESSSQSLKPGDEVTVTIRIAGTEQVAGDPIGVFLLSSLENSGSIPTNSGWTILEDPNGGTNNYVEKPADADGSSEFIWKLKAPNTPDRYTLYSREHHGNGDNYFMEIVSGLEIEVIDETADPGDSTQPDTSGEPGDNKSESPDDSTPDNLESEDDKRDADDNKNNNDRDRMFSSEAPLAPLILGLIAGGIVIMITHILRD